MSSEEDGTSTDDRRLFSRISLPSLDESGETPQLLDALHRAGYIQELRVARTLEGAGYTVLLNRIHELTRGVVETDILALKDVVLAEQWLRGDRTVRAVLRSLLIVECVNNPRPLALFARVHQKTPAETPFLWSADDFIKSATGEMEPLAVSAFELLRQEVGVRLEQAFCATQYCAFDAKRPSDSRHPETWVATQSEHSFKPIESLCGLMAEARRMAPEEPGVYYYARPILLTARKNVLVQHDPTGALCIDEASATTLLWSPRTGLGQGTATRIDVLAEDDLNEYLPFCSRMDSRVANALRSRLEEWPEWR